MSGLFKNFGRLPAEYNERVHGPYDPAVYYGKSKTIAHVIIVFIKISIYTQFLSCALLYICLLIFFFYPIINIKIRF